MYVKLLPFSVSVAFLYNDRSSSTRFRRDLAFPTELFRVAFLLLGGLPYFISECLNIEHIIIDHYDFITYCSNFVSRILICSW